MAQETLYSERDAFFLEINGMDFKIREPIGWDKADINIERDEEKHGLTFSFPGKDIQLEFGMEPDEESGERSKVLIDTEYALNGPDANIYIKFGAYNGVDITELYTRRRLDLADEYVSTLRTTRCKTVKEGIDTLISDFSDVSVNMEQLETVLGNPMPGVSPAPKTAINLHSKAIRQTYQANSQAEILTFDPMEVNARTTDPPEPYLYGQIRLSDEVADGLVEDQNLPTGFSNFDPIEISRGNYRVLNPSTKFVSFEASIDVLIKYRKSGVNDTVPVRTYVNINGQSFLMGTVNVSSFGGFTLEQFRIQHTLSHTFPTETDASAENNEIFYYFEIDYSAGQSSTLFGIESIQVYENEKATRFKVVGETFFKPTVVEGIKIHNALSYMFKAILEEEGLFRSDFYEFGEGSKMILNNGNKIRELNDPLRAPTFSIDDAYDALNLLHGIGQGFEVNSAGDRVVRWERLSHFYRDAEIISLIGYTYDYEILGNKEAFPNKVILAYPRLTVREDEGANTIDEYNSEIEIVLPIERTEKKVTIKSPWRLSGYDTETSRRLSVKPTESYKSDDDIFLFYVKNALTRSNIKMIFEYTDNNDENQLFIYFKEADYRIHFKYVSKITVSGDTAVGTQNINGLYNYNPTLFKYVETGTPTETYIRVPATADAGVAFTGGSIREVEGLTLDTSEFRAERTEEFLPPTGIIDPDSAYNLRAHPLRAFVNHCLLFNQALYYKAANAKYRVQFKKENRDLVTQLDAAEVEANPIGDTSFAIMNEAEGIEKQNADGGRYLVRPIKVKFKADINFTELQQIRNAIENQDNPNLNGYITTIDNEENVVQVYPDSINGLPQENIYEIIGRLRGNYYD